MCPCSGNKFINSALNRLTESETDPRNRLQRLTHLIDQFLFRYIPLPHTLRLEYAHIPCFIRPSCIKCNTRLPSSRRNNIKFIKSLQLCCHTLINLHRCSKRNTGKHRHIHIKRPFIHGRNKLRAQFCQNKQRNNQGADSHTQNLSPLLHRIVKKRHIPSQSISHQHTFFFLLRLQKHYAESRNHKYRKKQRCQKGNSNCYSERPEHLAFNAGKRKNGQEGNCNDEFSENTRFSYLHHRVKHRVELRNFMVIFA